jgi:hypothetical protein
MIGLRNLGVVIALVAPTLAMAAGPATTAAVRAACGPDARKLCSAVIRDPEARHKCMVEHRAQLSEACKAALAQSHQAPAPAAAPTGDAAPPENATPSAPAAPPENATPSAPAAPPADSPNTK